MWSRWQREFEETRRQSDRRHEDWVREFEDDKAERRKRHAEFLVEQKRRFGDLDAAMENDKQVTRRMVLELREQTVRLHDLGHGIQANTEGLLRVLDELRREDGPGEAA